MNDPKSALSLWNGTADQPGLSQAVDPKIRPQIDNSLNAQSGANDLKNVALKTSLDIQNQFPNDIAKQEKALNQMFLNGKMDADQHGAALGLLRADHTQLRSEQIENDKSLIGTIWDMKNNNPNLTLTNLSPSQMAYIKQRGLGNQVDNILRGELTKSDPSTFNNLQHRIYLPDGDPKKITSPAQLFDAMESGRLNYADNEKLRKEITEANTPEGNPFLKQVNTIKETGRHMLTGSMSAIAIQHPELASEAAYRFGNDLDQRIKDYRTAGKDPQNLFTPGNPDYVLNPNRVAAFMPSEADIAAAKANPVTIQPQQSQGVIYNGYKFPNQDALDKYKKAGGK